MTLFIAALHTSARAVSIEGDPTRGKVAGWAWRECGGVGRQEKGPPERGADKGEGKSRYAIRKEEAAHPPNSSELAASGRLRQHGPPSPCLVR